ncbi:MAG: phage terminase small subunit P27 family [Clostridia bacterium]
MGKRGPKPGIKNLEKIQKREINAEKTLKVPAAPKWMKEDKIACDEWKRVAKLLVNSSIFKDDMSALECYCKTYSRWRQSEEFIEKNGYTFITPNGYEQQRPEVGISNKSLTLCKQFMAEFGLTPASRSGLNIKQPIQLAGESTTNINKLALDMNAFLESKGK